MARAAMLVVALRDSCRAEVGQLRGTTEHFRAVTADDRSDGKCCTDGCNALEVFVDEFVPTGFADEVEPAVALE